jgi:trans-aconitate 2-methyltransferase
MDAWDGKYYGEHFKKKKISIFDRFKNYSFCGDEVVLDVGCGDGQLTAELAQSLSQGKVVGVDGSASMISEAKQSYPEVSFYHSDIAVFDCSERFDFIYSFRTFHWIKDKVPVIKNLKRLLKPGGTILIQQGSSDYNSLFEAMANVTRGPRWQAHFTQQPETFFPKSAEKMEKILRRAGFVKFEIEVSHQYDEHNNIEDLVAWFMCWMSHSTGLSGGNLKDFAREVAEYMYQGKDHFQVIKRDQPVLQVLCHI